MEISRRLLVSAELADVESLGPNEKISIPERSAGRTIALMFWVHSGPLSSPHIIGTCPFCGAMESVSGLSSGLIFNTDLVQCRVRVTVRYPLPQRFDQIRRL